jgi:hypothetical protein
MVVQPKEAHMWSWIVTGVLYAIGIGTFRLVGGMGSAMEALRDWGRASAERRRPTPSSG